MPQPGWNEHLQDDHAVSYARSAAVQAIVCVLLASGFAEAGQSDGPAPPVPPAVITRDASGRATVRATRLQAEIHLDGQLDEAVYSEIEPISGLIQVEPQAGLPATQNTEAWVMFDAEALYVSVRCWESRLDRMVANEMRRDGANLYQNEYVGIVLDTFNDHLNGAYFAVTPLGGRGDGQLTNERQFNKDFNPVWDVEVGRFQGGWTLEAVIPFKSLRYRSGRAQIWGFNLERSNRWKNEESFLTRIPASFGWSRAFMQVSYAATLVGLEVPPSSRNLDIKPYMVSNLTTDTGATPQVSNALGGDVGVDVKYGVTKNLTVDLTYNTDFAQVEADEQQVNLTRFNLFFPEKRDFFLENQGTFSFGGAVTSGSAANTSDTPIFFYSRRIGLTQVGSQTRVEPLLGGGRLTGRIGRFSAGVLSIQSDDLPTATSWKTQALRTASFPTNFSVMRLKRDVLRRSSIGVMYTGRSISQTGGPRNDGYGADAMFGLFDNLTINAYWARTRTEGRSGNDRSYRGQLDYAGDRYGVQLERLAVGDQFNPELGFVRRVDMRKNFGLFRFSPRPHNSKLIRKLYWIGSIAYIEDGAGRLVTRDTAAEFNIEFQNSDRFILANSDSFEFLALPFNIAPGVKIPAGGYEFNSSRVGFNFGKQRKVSGNVLAEHGSFYTGHKTAISVSTGRLNLSPQFSLEPTVSLNRVDLAEGSFTARLAGSRVTYTVTPRMFFSALLQYNSSNNTVTSNARVRWEYRPGSELFLVYNEQRDTLARQFPALTNRAVIFKINRLVRF